MTREKSAEFRRGQNRRKTATGSCRGRSGVAGVSRRQFLGGASAAVLATALTACTGGGQMSHRSQRPTWARLCRCPGAATRCRTCTRWRGWAPSPLPPWSASAGSSRSTSWPTSPAARRVTKVRGIRTAY
ncbi:twin-arginine translocation signal domain-containing protein [Nonomuraea aurantiaca]|uniref:twin-arginine translocation signal domain-containing protein n=1 Tax=Nonomuraea aurantiaca TaxID=2878562 RepID=UPI001CD9BE76|nr:twin-arginine translocation signal domain-containing protein [Nonomuraea aurantiaca]